MATFSPASDVGTSGWTQLDTLASSTVGGTQNKDTTQAMGLIIATTDPGAGVAWNANTAMIVLQGDERIWAKGASEHVWGRMQTGTNALRPVTWEKA